MFHLCAWMHQCNSDCVKCVSALSVWLPQQRKCVIVQLSVGQLRPAASWCRHGQPLQYVCRAMWKPCCKFRKGYHFPPVRFKQKVLCFHSSIIWNLYTLLSDTCSCTLPLRKWAIQENEHFLLGAILEAITASINGPLTPFSLIQKRLMH